LSKIESMPREILGIDCGSANTRIYSYSAKGIVFDEPTALCLNPDTGEVRETGFLAEKIEGRAPYHFEVVRPVKHGLVQDVDALSLYLQKVLSSLHVSRQFRGLTILFSTPSESSKVNQNALIEVGRKLDAKAIYIESQGKLAAFGAGENVDSPRATLVCNIGSGVTDIAALSMGEIVASETSYLGGDSFNGAIRRTLLLDSHLAIGMKTAEALKRKIGTLSEKGESRLAEVKGRDTLTSLPSSAVVSSASLEKSLVPIADFLALKVTDVISRLPAELSSDLVTSGLVLSGGGALMDGAKEFFQKRLGLLVRTGERPELSVVRGMGLYMESQILASENPR